MPSLRGGFEAHGDIFFREFPRHLHHHLAHEALNFVRRDSGVENEAELILIVQQGATDEERVVLPDPIQDRPFLLDGSRRLRGAFRPDLLFGRGGGFSACFGPWQAAIENKTTSIKGSWRMIDRFMAGSGSLNPMNFFLFRDCDRAYIL